MIRFIKFVLTISIVLVTSYVYAEVVCHTWQGTSATTNWRDAGNWDKAVPPDGSNAGGWLRSNATGNIVINVNEPGADYTAWTRYLLFGDSSDTASTNFTLNPVDNSLFRFKCGHTTWEAATAPVGSGYVDSPYNKNGHYSPFATDNFAKTSGIWAEGTGNYTINSDILWDSGGLGNEAFILRNNSTGTLALGSVESACYRTIMDGTGLVTAQDLKVSGGTFLVEGALDATKLTLGGTVLSGSGQISVDTLHVTAAKNARIEVSERVVAGTVTSGAGSTLQLGTENAAGRVLEITGSANLEGNLKVCGFDSDGGSMLILSGEGSTFKANTLEIERGGVLTDGEYPGAINVTANVTLDTNINALWLKSGIGVAEGKTATLLGSMTDEGNKTVLKLGAGTLVLKSTGNTAGSASFEIQKGTLRLDAGSTLSSTILNVSTGAILSLNGGVFDGGEVKVKSVGRVQAMQSGFLTDTSKYTFEAGGILSLGTAGWTNEQIGTVLTNSNASHLELIVADGTNYSYALPSGKTLLLDLGAGSTYTTTQAIELLAGLSMTNATLNAATDGSISMVDISTSRMKLYVHGDGVSTINAKRLYMTLGNHGHFYIDPESTLKINAELSCSTNSSYKKELHIHNGGTLELLQHATYDDATYVHDGSTLKLSVLGALPYWKDVFVEEGGTLWVAADGGLMYDTSCPSMVTLTHATLLNTSGKHSTLPNLTLEGSTVTAQGNVAMNTVHGDFILDRTVIVKGEGETSYILTSDSDNNSITLRTTDGNKTGGTFHVWQGSTLVVDGKFRRFDDNRKADTILKVGLGALQLGSKFKTTTGMTVSQGILDISGYLITPETGTSGWNLLQYDATNADVKRGLVFQDGSELRATITKNADGTYSYDQLTFDNLTVGNDVRLTLDLVGETWTNDDLGTYQLFDTETLGHVTGLFTDVALNAESFPALVATLGANGELSLGVPEPATWCLLLLGFCGMIGLRRYGKRFGSSING